MFSVCQTPSKCSTNANEIIPHSSRVRQVLLSSAFKQMRLSSEMAELARSQEASKWWEGT